MRVVNSRTAVQALVVLLLCTSFSGQTRKLSTKDLPKSAFKLIAIKVKGTSRYNDEDIIAASGLQTGQNTSEADFKKATQQLADSGMFTDLAYAFHYSPDGTELDFQLTDNPRVIPARFDNFPWFSEQELRQKLHSRLPLFKGELPLAGGLADEVSDALQGMLIERKVEGSVDYLRFAKDDGPIEAMVYRVSGPAIHVQNVSFDGAGQAELPALGAAAAKLKGMDYSLETIQIRSEKDLLPVYRQRGYLKAVLGDPIPKIAQDSAQETLVDITFPVKPGRQYKLDSLELRGYKAVAVDDLRKAMKSRPGEVANQVQLSNDMEAIKKLYEANGYMAAEIQPMPEFNEEESTVKYILQIKEGDLYKMGELDILGLDGRTTARLEEQWKIRGGDPFKGDYPAQFIRDALKQLSLMGSWKAGMHLGINHKDKTVDVSLRFDPDDRR